MPGGPRKRASSRSVDELGGGELEDEAAIHLLVEVEVEGVEGLVRIAKVRLLVRRSSSRSLRRVSSSATSVERKSIGAMLFALRFEEAGLERRRPCRRGAAGASAV